MFTAVALCLVVLIPTLAEPRGLASEADPQGPEQTEEGRKAYFGREIARTMHWSEAEWLMRESREDEENSSLMLEQLGIKQGQTVCDFGCGAGYLTLPIAERVGPEGKVLAVDLQPQMLDLLNKRLEAAGHKNVTTVEATLMKTGLEAQSCDVILLADVYHEISHPVTVLRELRRALKPKGRLYFLEFRLEDTSVPIKPVHKMSKSQLLLEMSANGLRFAREFDGLPWQHLMAFERDPSFPRAKGQVEANGRALAAGLARALRSGELNSLLGFYGAKIFEYPGSALLTEEEEKEGGVWIWHSEWESRIREHWESVTAKSWRSALAKTKLRVVEPPVTFWPGDDPCEITLASTDDGYPDKQTFAWVLARNDHGQWLVQEECFAGQP